MTRKAETPKTRATLPERILRDQLKQAMELVEVLEKQVEPLKRENSELRVKLTTAIEPAPGYESLVRILGDAHAQAAYGKGSERHGNGLPFGAQPMQTIGFLLHSSEGMLYQVMKKVQEANSQLERARRTTDPVTVKDAKTFARRELLGAIVYTAGALVFEEAH